MEKTLRVEDVATRLGCSVPSAYRLLKQYTTSEAKRNRVYGDEDVEKIRHAREERTALQTIRRPTSTEIATYGKAERAERVDFSEIGTAAMRRWGGSVQEERIRELQGYEGRQLLHEMRINNPVISAVFLAIENALRRVTWRVAPKSEATPDKECARFVESCLYDMSCSWNEQLQYILSFLEYGFSTVEIVVKRRLGADPPKYTSDPAPSQYDDNRIGWRKWAYRPAESLSQGNEWIFDASGGIQGIRQAPIFGEDKGVREIPIKKLLLFRTNVLSPEGTPIHRSGFVSWWYVKNLQEIEGISIERSLAGLPVVYLGDGTKKTGSNSDYTQAKDMVVNLRSDEQAGVVIPYPKLGTSSDGRGMLLELLASPGRLPFNAQPLSAKILTPNGWKIMGDICIGDEIACPLGYKSIVTGVFPRGQRPVYRVVLNDGASTLVDAEHLWVVTNNIWRFRANKEKNHLRKAHPILADYKVLNTLEVQAETQKRRYRISKLHLPPIKPIEFYPRQALPVDPYVLGVLLGDGWCNANGGAPRFASADHEVADEVQKRLPRDFSLTEYVQESAGKAKIYRIGYIKSGVASSFRKDIEQLGLAGKGAKEKFIPEIYLWSDIQSRIDLLQGLMDTDGTIGERTHASFTTVSKNLADGIMQLISSLGGTAKLSVGKSFSPRRPREGQTGIYYKVGNIHLPSDIIPFKLPRKANRFRGDIYANRNKNIVSIKYVGEMEVQCISVSSPSRMYITDDFIPTHNTSEVIRRYQKELALSMLASFILLGMDAVGSYALGRLQADIFVLAVSAWATNIAEIINRHAIPRLLKYNVFPGITGMPTLVPSDVGIPNLEEMAYYVNTLVNAGVLVPDKEVERHLRQIAHLPQKIESAEDEAGNEEQERLQGSLITRSKRFVEAARVSLMMTRLQRMGKQGTLDQGLVDKYIDELGAELARLMGLGSAEVGPNTEADRDTDRAAELRRRVARETGVPEEDEDEEK